MLVRSRKIAYLLFGSVLILNATGVSAQNPFASDPVSPQVERLVERLEEIESQVQYNERQTQEAIMRAREAEQISGSRGADSGQSGPGSSSGGNTEEKARSVNGSIFRLSGAILVGRINGALYVETSSSTVEVSQRVYDRIKLYKSENEGNTGSQAANNNQSEEGSEAGGPGINEVRQRDRESLEDIRR